MSDNRQLTTYSMWRSFRDCRMACKYRYFDNLSPLERAHSLAFGSVIHDCLEKWHGTRDLAAVLAHIDQSYPKRAVQDGEGEGQRADWNLATVMMQGYAQTYTNEDFQIVALEKGFQGPIINPATGAESRSFLLAGKVDGIVLKNGQHYLLEHKTASLIDGAYLERLWTDFQITLYAGYLEKVLGIRITGIIYNVLARQNSGSRKVKPRLNTRLGARNSSPNPEPARPAPSANSLKRIRNFRNV